MVPRNLVAISHVGSVNSTWFQDIWDIVGELGCVGTVEDIVRGSRLQVIGKVV